MKQFNINQYIYIRLTDSGIEFINSLSDKVYTDLILKSYVVINNEKWCKLQCWVVFEIFPVRASETYFKPTIMFDDQDLIEVV